MKGAWGMAKDQLTGDSADDNYEAASRRTRAATAVGDLFRPARRRRALLLRLLLVPMLPLGHG